MRPTPTEPICEALKATPNKAKPYGPKEYTSKINAASGAGSTSHISGGSKCPLCLHYISEFCPTKCFKFYRNDTGLPGMWKIAVEDRYDDRRYPNMSDNDRFSSSTENSFLVETAVTTLNAISPKLNSNLIFPKQSSQLDLTPRLIAFQALLEKLSCAQLSSL
ncbi:uncharacterized protein STEHIDRAFT_159304 [Stereum hirsutum FP-91666 SS1]|uniref:uncharacterized protein n=1 Tax=Stereum hirsutum (strain FP-91666) TaxID=721885 RepID=UPI0004449B6C|nr:uncharacterized protein STEHIDRAFT_159304 [Stereum hirsutum FP-91666 SS1]EIM83679.1 hypothetical protein STEHIDRAFT_159304 [Stereum hirsutum FP-91666 SS1]